MISRWEKDMCLPNTLNIFKLATPYRTMVDALFFNLIRASKERIVKREGNLEEKTRLDEKAKREGR